MNTLLQIFAKAPELGKVKTRVAASLGDERALQLHKLLCSSIIETAVASNADQVEIWTTNDFGLEYFSETGLSVKLQQGEHLGQRMQFALQQGLGSFHDVVLVGADAYSLSSQDINTAFQLLHSHAMVFGPALDGGYVLIGGNQLETSVFEDMPWGQASVFNQTQQKLEARGTNYAVLDKRWDIDTLEDLQKFAPDLLASLT